MAIEKWHQVRRIDARTTGNVEGSTGQRALARSDIFAVPWLVSFFRVRVQKLSFRWRGDRTGGVSVRVIVFE
jgi:hypothetical protein